MSASLTRRQAMQAAAAVGIGLAARPAAAADAKPRYRVAACDWMLLKRQKLGALPLAKECGLDGVEVDMGSLGDGSDIRNELRKPEVRKQYLDTARKLGIDICSLAMSAFYAQSYAEDPRAEQYTAEWIELMPKLGVTVGFLPLGVRGDLVKRPDVRPAIVARLKPAAALAEKAKVVIGLETSLDAAGNVRLLEEIGSPAVRVYFNPKTAFDHDKDLLAEIRHLGKDRICQFHFSDRDGTWLEDGRIDVPRVKSLLDDLGWSGWLVIERSRKPGKSVKENFSANAAYLKKVFRG
jgi:sugar phosphate isomerase/epimerase